MGQGPNRHFSKEDIQAVHEEVFSTANHQGDKVRTSVSITPHLLGWLVSRRQETSVGKDVKKRKAWCSVGGNVNWYSFYRK